MFTCGICQNEFDDALKNLHHRIPQSFGGDDSPTNMRTLCAGCHQTLHRLAEHLMNPHKAGLTKDIAKNYCQTYCQNPQRAIPIILDLAKCACEYELKVSRGDLKLAPWSEKVLSVTIPMFLKNEFEKSCKRKIVFGKVGNMTTVIEDFILKTLSQECPNLRKDISSYIGTRTKNYKVTK